MGWASALCQLDNDVGGAVGEDHKVFQYHGIRPVPGAVLETDLGPHLRAAYEQGTYELGTVPADQMIGRAFFVYWPGFMPLSSKGPNLLPDLGRVRWIH